MRDRFSRDRFGRPPADDKHSINSQISAREVRVIGADGSQLGVLKTYDAIKLAEDQGLDLVEVSPGAVPPVCKILDYGKLRYREQKKAAEARKNAAVQVVKELRLRYNTDDHDLEVKLKNARKFLADGDRVRFTMRFKGREVTYQDLGREIFDQIVTKLEDVAKIEERTPLLGRSMILVVSPKGAAAAKEAAQKAAAPKKPSPSVSSS